MLSSLSKEKQQQDITKKPQQYFNCQPLMDSKRIRVVHHPLQVNLLIAVRTRLLFTHNAPATDAELMESVGSGSS